MALNALQQTTESVFRSISINELPVRLAARLQMVSRLVLPAPIPKARRPTVLTCRCQAVDEAAGVSPAAAAAYVQDGDSNSLPLPSAYHQPKLTGKERAALRAHAESLAKAKTLQRLQVGAKGITQTVLMAAMDVLMKYEYLRIKLGEGCGLERKQTAEELSKLLDAAVVGQVGFTITFYRQKGLPRPDSLV